MGAGGAEFTSRNRSFFSANCPSEPPDHPGVGTRSQTQKLNIDWLPTPAPHLQVKSWASGDPRLNPHHTGLDLDLPPLRSPSPSQKNAEALPHCLIDGEVVALDKRGLPSFGALQACAFPGGKNPKISFFFFAF